MRERIQLISNCVLASYLSDPAAARGQAIMALGQTIENQATIVGNSGVIAVVGAMLILAVYFVLLTINRKSQPVRSSRRTVSRSIFDEYRAKTMFLCCSAIVAVGLSATAASATPLAASATPLAGSATPSAGSATPSAASATPSAGSATPSAGSATPSAASATPSAASATPSAGSATQSAASAAPSAASGTQSASPVGTWLTANGHGVVAVARCGDALCGRIVGIDRKPTEPMPTDVHGRSQCGLTIIANVKPESDASWLGEIIDPRDGGKYQAKLAVDENGNLRLRGFIGIPALGATQVWHQYTGHLTANCGLA